MGNLVMAAMLVAILGGAYQTAVARNRRLLPALALALGAIAIGITATEVLPSAARIVQGTEPNPTQLDLAQRVAVAHMLCFFAFVVYVAVQVGLALRNEERPG